MFLGKLIILYYSIVQRDTIPKINNIDKYDSNDQTIKNKKYDKLYIQDEKTSKSYTMEAVAFFDRLIFDDLNNDKSEIDYIEKSI